jgi:rRNA maturation RNase YbeY
VAVYFFTEDIAFKINQKQIIKKWIKYIIESREFKLGDINYIFTSEEKILAINKSYLNHNYLTDIITFPYSIGKIISSDIYICIPVVKINAQNYQQKFSDELNRVIAHGVLHLIGYNDSTKAEEKVMRKAEDESLLVLKEMYNAKKF